MPIFHLNLISRPYFFEAPEPQSATMWAAHMASGLAVAPLAAKIPNDFFHDFPKCRFNACRQAPFELMEAVLAKRCCLTVDRSKFMPNKIPKDPKDHAKSCPKAQKDGRTTTHRRGAKKSARFDLRPAIWMLKVAGSLFMLV